MMWCPQILLWTDRDDPRRIDIIVGHVVMTFNMIEIDGFGDSWGLINIAQIGEKVWITGDLAKIAFKMTVIDRVEADQGHEEPQVGFQ